MRPLNVVVVQEGLEGAVPRTKGRQRLDVEALVIDRAKEPLDLPIALGFGGPEHPMRNAQAPTGLLKPRQSRRWRAYRIVKAKALSVSTASIG